MFGIIVKCISKSDFNSEDYDSRYYQTENINKGNLAFFSIRKGSIGIVTGSN